MSKFTEKYNPTPKGKYQGTITSAKYNQQFDMIKMEVVFLGGEIMMDRSYNGTTQFGVFKDDMARIGFPIGEYETPVAAVEALNEAKPVVEFLVDEKNWIQRFLRRIDDIEIEPTEKEVEEITIPDLAYKSRIVKVDGRLYRPLANTKIKFRRIDKDGKMLDLFGLSPSHGVGNWEHDRTWKEMNEILEKRKRDWRSEEEEEGEEE